MDKRIHSLISKTKNGCNMREIVSILLCVACTMPALAQHHKKEYTNFNDTILSIGEVIISTNHKEKAKVLKLDVPASYIPIATNTLPSKIWVERGIQNIQEAARFLPGVRFQTSYGAFQQMSIRGFDHSVIMVDGVRDERSSINNSYPFMDLSSVESIELLKGPASVLYGQSAVGGVVNVVRKAPSEKQTVNARVAYGSWYNLQTTIGAGGKLAGPLNYYGSFNYQTQDGWRDNAQKRLSGYLAIGGQLTEKDEVDVRVAGNRDFYSTEIGLPNVMPADIYNVSDGSLYLHKDDMLPGLDKKARYNSESDFMYNRSFNVSGMYKHTFNDAFKLMDKVSYSYDDIDYFGTESLSYLTDTVPNKKNYKHYYETNGKRTYICLDSIYYDYPLRFSHVSKTINNQLELNGKFETGGISHHYLAGYSFIYLHRDSYSGYQFGSKGDDVTGPGLTGHGSVYNPHSIGWMDTKFSKVTPQRTYMHGIYLQDLIEFSRQLKVMIAGRYDIYRLKRVSNINVINGRRDYNEPDENAFSQIDNKAFTFRIGAVYLPIEDLSIFASFGTYFKPINEFFNPDVIYVNKDGQAFEPKGKEVFKPEKGFQVELGARYELSNKLQAGFSVFYINKYNVKRTLANKNDVINGETLGNDIVGQVGRMDSRGFDAELTWTPVSELMLSTGYAYTNAKVREMADNRWMAGDASKDKQYAYIPQNTFYVLGDYTVSKGWLKDFGANVSVSYQDEVYRNANNSTAFPSYWITDLGFSYKLKNNVRLGVNINNLFDKEYYNQALGNQYVPSMPRNFLLSAQYSF